MKKTTLIFITFISTLLFLSGCSKVQVDVRGSETAYKYTQDINDADRYNAGSDYFYVFPFEISPRIIYVDYAIQSVPFEATYTLPTEQKISITVKAEILFKLERNPLDKNSELSYAEDQYMQYFTESVSAIPNNNRDFALNISPLSMWNKVMAEPTDLAFRSVFTDAKKYDSFDSVESSIVLIQKQIKEELSAQAAKHHLSVVGVKIEDVPVPLEIGVSRDKNLKLTQESINQIQELEILTKNAAMKMAVDVRYAMNSAIIDKLVLGHTNKGYKFLEILRMGMEKGNAMQINITPDFMRYLDEDSNKADSYSNEQLKSSNDLFEKLSAMDDKQLTDYFNGKNK